MPLKSKESFSVGGYYRDRKQGYSVLSLDPDGMTVQFDDGTRRKLDDSQIAIKARIYRNIVGEERQNHPEATEEYFRTLGYLSANGRFEAELPARSVSGFLDHYHHSTDERVSTEHNSVILLGDVDKWGPELRIYFPVPSFKTDFGPNVDVRSAQTPDNLRINNNAFWNRLIGLGYRLGKSHDVDAIRQTVPLAMHSVFDEGRGL